MGTDNIDPIRSKIQLEVLRERIKYLETRNKQQEKDLLEARDSLRRQDIDLGTMRDERDDLRIKWEVMRSEIKHLQDSLTQSNQINTKSKSILKRQGFIASLIFLLSSVLVNVGTTLLTSNPPSPLGWVMIALATASYIVAALMTTLFAEGGN
jgi:hypothetical protein